MVGYGRERFYERILKFFGFLKSVAQAAVKCPNHFFLSRFLKKVGRYQSIETSDLKIIYFSIGKSDFKNFWFFGFSYLSRTKKVLNTFVYLVV